MYSKIGWKNLPDMSTPVSAANLNHMDEGIYDNATKIGSATLLTDAQTLTAAINELLEKIDDVESRIETLEE